ncbi:MAG: hypothetical protein ABIQ30_17165 [Devosia sp.]
MRQIAFMRREVKGFGTAGLAAALLPHNNLGEGQMEVYDPHKTTTEVRQANGRLDNLWVLIISMVGVVALFAIIYLVFLASTPPMAS